MNNHQAMVMPYTGSSAKITAVVRAFNTFRLATNRLCARPVQNTPSKLSHSQSMAGTAGRDDHVKGRRHRRMVPFCQSAAWTGSTSRVTARLSRESKANVNPETIPYSRPSVL